MQRPRAHCKGERRRDAGLSPDTPICSDTGLLCYLGLSLPICYTEGPNQRHRGVPQTHTEGR